MDIIFLPKKKKLWGKKKKIRPPYWLQKRTPAGPETEVFLGWPQTSLPLPTPWPSPFAPPPPPRLTPAYQYWFKF